MYKQTKQKMSENIRIDVNVQWNQNTQAIKEGNIMTAKLFYGSRGKEN